METSLGHCYKTFFHSSSSLPQKESITEEEQSEELGVQYIRTLHTYRHKYTSFPYTVHSHTFGPILHPFCPIVYPRLFCFIVHFLTLIYGVPPTNIHAKRDGDQPGVLLQQYNFLTITEPEPSEELEVQFMCTLNKDTHT